MTGNRRVKNENFEEEIGTKIDFEFSLKFHVNNNVSKLFFVKKGVVKYSLGLIKYRAENVYFFTTTFDQKCSNSNFFTSTNKIHFNS